MRATSKHETKRYQLRAVLLASTVGIALSGCAGGPPVVAQAGQLCRDWIVQDRSKDDKLTERTASNMEASNNSRVEWGCDPRENRAKAG